MSISVTARAMRKDLEAIEYKWGKIPLENMKSTIYSIIYDRINNVSIYHQNSKNDKAFKEKENTEVQWFDELVKTVKTLKDEKDTEACHKLFKNFMEDTTIKYLGSEALNGDLDRFPVCLSKYIEGTRIIQGSLPSVKQEINEIISKKFKPAKKEPINTLVFSNFKSYLNFVAPEKTPDFNFKKYGLYLKHDKRLFENGFEKIMPYDLKNSKVSLSFDMAIMDGIKLDDCCTDPFCSADSLLSYKNHFLFLFRHIKKDAPIIVTLNAYYLKKDTILFLSNYIDNIAVHYNKDGNIIIISGTKKGIRTPSPKDFNNVISDIIIGELRPFNEVIEFLNNTENDIIFECLYYDEKTIIDMISRNSAKAFIVEDKILEDMQLKNKTSKISPPLPLNPGQIGLVLVSGHMDGLVDADGDTPHLISGNVFKKQDRNVTNEDDAVITKKTSYYSTLITIVDNNGDFMLIS